MDGLQFSVIPKCNIVRRLFGPALYAYGAEVFSMPLHDINPADRAIIRILRAQRHHVDHVAVQFLHCHDPPYVRCKFGKQVFLFVV